MPDAGVITRTFEHEGRRLIYDEYGSGRRAFVLVHGLLLSRKMHAPLAADLAERGHRVVVPDLLGHGDSERPSDMWRYSMPIFGEEVVALFDHLELDEAVVGGTSLGANVSLEAAVLDPARIRGLVIEMPVLDNALFGCAIAFSPLLVLLTFGEPLARLIASGARRLPRGLHQLADVGLDWISQDPRPSAAVLQGLFFGRAAPPRSQRATIEAPTLVIGHPRDPIHPFSDSDMLVRELPRGQLLEASSILELRLSPERLTGEIASFLDACWQPAAARGRSRTGGPARKGRAAGARRRGADRTRPDAGGPPQAADRDARRR